MRRFWAAALLAAMAPTGATAVQAASLPTEAQLPPLAGGTRFVASDGVRLWYRDSGRRDGIPVVFLHGGPGEGSMVLQGAGGPDLEQRVRLVYFDQRGAGRSARPDDHRFYSAARIAADIDELRQQLGVPKIILLGHSAGTVFALDFAQRHPDRVAGLVLTGAVPDIPAAMDRLCERLKLEGWDRWAKAVRAAAPGRKCDPFQAFDGAENQRWINRNMFPNPKTEALVDRLDKADGLGNSGQMGGALWDSLFKDYRFTAADRLTMPVLLIDGGSDHQTDEVSQQALVGQLKAGEFRSYGGVGHFPFVEQPRRFARDVAAFVRAIEKAGPRS